MALTAALKPDFSPVLMRLNDHTTSSALKVLPLWNLTPRRSLNSQVLSSMTFHDSASTA